MHKSLAELAKVYYGKSPAAVKTEVSDIPIYGTSGLVGYASKPLYETPGIVVGRKGTLGNPIFSEGKFWAIDTTYAVIAKYGVDTKWLYYQLDNFNLERLNEATGVPSINRDYLYKIEFSYCDLPEQRKIADILSTLDAAIAQTEALIRKYQRIKQGLMQDLLTRGVDENGELRDPDKHPESFHKTKIGVIPKLWNIASIKEKTHTEVGGTPSTAVPEYWREGNIPWMSSGDVYMRRIYDVPGRVTQRGLAASNAKLISAPAIAMALAGQGKTRGTVALTKIELCTNQSVALIKPTSADLDITFLFYDLEFRYEELRSISMGSGRAGLSKQVIEKILIPLPKIQEQQTIAQILEAQDNAIEVETIFLEKLVALKHGLMQDLLSGSVRVSGVV